MTESSRPWRESARRSLDAAEVLHAHQAVELALKALIAHRNLAPPRLHSIADLLARQDVAVRQAVDHVADDLRDLDGYYTATRYPDVMTGTMPGQREADEALAAAKEGVAIIEHLLDRTP
jgi:HEPN domain-containing protein